MNFIMVDAILRALLAHRWIGTPLRVAPARESSRLSSRPGSTLSWPRERHTQCLRPRHLRARPARPPVLHDPSTSVTTCSLYGPEASLRLVAAASSPHPRRRLLTAG